MKIKGKRLPHQKLDETKYEELKKRKHFYVCLVVLGKSKDRFKRIIKPTKVKFASKSSTLLIPDKGKSFHYDTSIYYFDNYEDCAKHFNKQIDEQSKEVKEHFERIKKKYEQMINMKVDLRKVKLKRILNE